MESLGYLHLGELTEEDLKSEEVKIWNPQYPIFGYESKSKFSTAVNTFINKYFECYRSCRDGGWGASKKYEDIPLKECSCFTDECNIDFYFNIDTEHPDWKDFLKELKI